jgi:hypothetical protein
MRTTFTGTVLALAAVTLLLGTEKTHAQFYQGPGRSGFVTTPYSYPFGWGYWMSARSAIYWDYYDRLDRALKFGYRIPKDPYYDPRSPYYNYLHRQPGQGLFGLGILGRRHRGHMGSSQPYPTPPQPTITPRTEPGVTFQEPELLQPETSAARPGS